MTVYFSGHGLPDVDSKKVFLSPVDVSSYKPRLSSYPLKVFYSNLAKLPARTVTVVLDACFSGTSGGGRVLRGMSPVTLHADLPAADSKLLVLSSSQGDEVSNWHDDARHGSSPTAYCAASPGRPMGTPTGTPAT